LDAAGQEQTQQWLAEAQRHGQTTTGLLQTSPVASALNWIQQPESAIVHGFMGAKSVIKGDFGDAASNFGKAAANVAHFAVPGYGYTPLPKGEVKIPTGTKGVRDFLKPLPQPLEFTAGFALDTALDPFSYVGGAGIATSTLRRGITRAALRKAAEEYATTGEAQMLAKFQAPGAKAVDIPAHEAIAQGYRVAKTVKEETPPHIMLPLRMFGTRTPIPVKKAFSYADPITGETVTGKQWTNLNKLKMKNYRVPEAYQKYVEGIQERGFGANIYVGIPKWMPTAAKPLGGIAAATSVTGRLEKKVEKGKKFRGAIREYGQHLATRIDETFGTDTNYDLGAVSEGVQRLTAAGAALPKELHFANTIATKAMNAQSAYFRDKYLRPIAKILNDNKIDSHYFYRLIDDPEHTQNRLPLHEYSGGTKSDAINQARELHDQFDAELQAYLKEHQVLTHGWEGYVPRYGRNRKAVDFLTSKEVRGKRKMPGKAGFAFERRFRYLRNLEDEWSRTRNGRSALRHPEGFESRVIETDYLKAMYRHVSEVTQAATGRELVRGLGDVTGGIRRPAFDHAAHVRSIEEARDAQIIENRRLASRPKELIAEERATAVHAEKARKESSAELRGLEKQYHERVGVRQKKLDTFARTLARLVRATREEGKGSKYVAIRARAEEQARALGRMTEFGGGDMGKVAELAQRAVRAADQGQVAAASQITLRMEKLMDEFAYEQLHQATIGATIPGAESVTGPGMLVNVKSRPTSAMSVSEFFSRVEASRTFGVPLPSGIQRGGRRAARRWREKNASTRSDGMNLYGKPSAQQRKTWRQMFSGPPERATPAELKAAAERDAEQFEREAGQELQQAQQNLRRATLTGDLVAVREAKARVREAEKLSLKAQRNLGRAEGSRVGQPGEIAAGARNLATIRAQLRKAKSQQKRYDKQAHNRHEVPLHQAESMDQWNEMIERLEGPDATEADKIIAAQAKRTGYILPAEVSQAYGEWSERINYAMNTPAELRVISRKWAGWQAMWKRYTLASTRRLIRDSLEDTLLLAVEGVRDPAIMFQTWRLLGVPIHDPAGGVQIENAGVRGMRSLARSKLINDKGVFTLGDGTVIDDDTMRQIMHYFGVTDVGRSSEASRDVGYTATGPLAQLGAARRGLFRARPSYGAIPSGLLSANQVRDNLPRVALFLHRLQEGDDIFSAVRRVDTIFFDYADLNLRLMGLRRHVAPFITFTAKSIPLLGRMAVEHPSYYSTTARTWESLQRESGVDPNEVIHQSSPSSPDNFFIPSPSWFTSLLGGRPDEGVLINPANLTRMSALNLLPINRGGSDVSNLPALMAGQALGGPGLDIISGVWNLDVRRGQSYNQWRSADPLSYNILNYVGGMTGQDLVQPLNKSYDESGNQRYRVNAQWFQWLKAVNPYIPGTAGAVTYGATLIPGFNKISGLNIIDSKNQRGRAVQRVIGEGTGLNPIPEERSRAFKYYLERNQK
jgi:hypothetical protein